jgi:lipid-binding SYLF domain-containing protein
MTFQERQNENIMKDPMMTSERQTTNENLRKDNITYQENRNLNENLTQTQPLQGSNLDSQDYWYYCSHSYTLEPHENEKETKYKFNKHKSHGKKMDTIICNSNELLREHFSLKNQMPLDLFQHCKGILLLRIWKGGLFLGGISGTGIVMARHNQKWSPPCAVSLGGLQIGFQVGIERVDDILILNDDTALKLFIEHGHFKLGVDASLAVGTFGRDSNLGVVMSEGKSKSIYSYSFAKGAFIGISLDGGVLSIDDKVNEEFYGRNIGVRDIFYGDIQIPQHSHDFMKMQELLNTFCTNEKNINESINSQNMSNPVIH